MKFTIENDIQYTPEGFNPTLIAFDVEAFHPTDKKIVPNHINGGVISMICAIFTKPDKTEHFKVYVLDQYAYDEYGVCEFVKERKNALKHQATASFRLDVIPCPNQTVMACKFLDDVADSGLSLLYGFNSSATA